jgi:hypothetical protein
MATTLFSGMTRLPLGALLFAAVTAGCGGDPETAPDGVDPAAETIAFTVAFVDAVFKEPLVGVEVCAAGRDDVPCAATAADGVVTLDLPAESELMLGCTIATHVTTYMTITTGRDDYDANVFMLLNLGAANALRTLSGAPDNPAKGIVIGNVYEDLAQRDQRVAGATYALSPAAGIGPVYGGEGGFPDPALTQSTIGGPGVIFDLDPGETTVTLSHSSRTCEGGFGWPTESATSLRTRVFAGGMSTVTFVCPP